jgi:hypothetical protein
VVALLFNGIFDPRGPEVQLDIFRNAACHLDPGGCFVVEGFVLCIAARGPGTRGFGSPARRRRSRSLDAHWR